MPNGVEITGVDETNAALKAFGGAVAKDTEAARKVAELIARGARGNAPVLTGELAASYRVQDQYVVNDVSYATFVEYGTWKTDAQYPIRDAAESSMEQAEQIYSDMAIQKAREQGFDTT